MEPGSHSETIGEFQVEQSGVATLGQAAEWASGEFSLRWEGGSLRTGLGDAR